eukprot:GHVS01041579.1.p1 GENE.GHVS01041579.1~~GHVS01041579.1.p1  ORF type:complete len:347 (+),score=97.11 GHVS01041579.1:356-1396(+)
MARKKRSAEAPPAPTVTTVVSPPPRATPCPPPQTTQPVENQQTAPVPAATVPETSSPPASPVPAAAVPETSSPPASPSHISIKAPMSSSQKRNKKRQMKKKQAEGAVGGPPGVGISAGVPSADGSGRGGDIMWGVSEQALKAALGDDWKDTMEEERQAAEALLRRRMEELPSKQPADAAPAQLAANSKALKLQVDSLVRDISHTLNTHSNKAGGPRRIDKRLSVAQLVAQIQEIDQAGNSPAHIRMAAAAAAAAQPKAGRSGAGSSGGGFRSSDVLNSKSAFALSVSPTTTTSSSGQPPKSAGGGGAAVPSVMAPTALDIHAAQVDPESLKWHLADNSFHGFAVGV